MKIVHIGKGKTTEELKHVVGLRVAGHDVYIPGDGTGEQLVRRIIDADEIHVWDASMVFQLGMIYFFGVHALHYNLGWELKVFCDPDPTLPIFQQRFEPGLDKDERQRPACLDDVILLPPVPPPFVPVCGSGLGPCKECAEQERCDKERAEHGS